MKTARLTFLGNFSAKAAETIPTALTDAHVSTIVDPLNDDDPKYV
jgi:hypothetical protein